MPKIPSFFGVPCAIVLLVAGFDIGHEPAVAESANSHIVTFEVDNYGTADRNLVVTFGSIFARGDVPHGSGVAALDGRGAPIPIQIDRKATNPDGSLRHAVLTLEIPHLAPGARMPVSLIRSDARPSSTPAVSVTDLPDDFDVGVILKTPAGLLTASARDLLKSHTPDFWLKGPLVSEWWVSGPFIDKNGRPHPHLGVRFGIRCYGRGRPLRLEVIVENDWTFVPHPQTEFYDAEIRAGGKTVFAQAHMAQSSQTRWRHGFWWSEPVALYVRQNLDYLKKSGAVPNYDPDLSIPESVVADLYDRFRRSHHGPLQAGIIMKYMPTTGGRPDIAPLPQWQALYLLSMDPRAYQVTLQTADLGASFPVHFRNEKTGLPVTPKDYPDMTTDADIFGESGQPERPDTGGYTNTLVPDESHEPALDFIPYLVTGDRFYLEELEFWTQWNAMRSGAVYHGFAAGRLNWGQIRGQAWSLRTLAQASYITPDKDTMKPILLRQLRATIGWYEQHFSFNSSANKLGIGMDPSVVQPYDDGLSMAPWQDDFLTSSVGYVQALGDVDALPLLRWKARFPIGRMIAPGFCWILASSYTLRVRDRARGDFYSTFAKVYQESLPVDIKDPSAPTDLKCASSEMAKALGLTVAGEMIFGSRSPDGFPAYLQPALAAAVDAGVSGANSAWILFQSRAGKPDFAKEPEWDIVPRSF
ncbi:MAG TPA: hypothetical protein VHX61_05840 [Rhizomicrobium sp.]|jgi:hypothetical protein|nr:hypothetical protein [Rhizomicrobium sp.]